jgi:hypothetical protein
LFLEKPGDCRLNEAAREFIEQFLAFCDRLSFAQLFLRLRIGFDLRSGPRHSLDDFLFAIFLAPLSDYTHAVVDCEFTPTRQ